MFNKYFTYITYMSFSVYVQFTASRPCRPESAAVDHFSLTRPNLPTDLGTKLGPTQTKYKIIT